MSGRMGAPVFRFARPNAFVQATSPLVMQDTTEPGTRYFARSAGMRSSRTCANGSSGPVAAGRGTPEANIKTSVGPKVLGAAIAMSVAARILRMQTEVGFIASPVNRKSNVGNVSTDIGETQDLAAAMPEKVKELQSKWDV